MAEILTDPLAHMLLLLTVLATAVMAASAALQGVRHELDLFGATVIAVAAAVGGGTVRDLLLGRMPVFWITDLTYLLTAIPVGALAFLVGRTLPSGNGRRLRLLMMFDAAGLALFTLVGIEVALGAQVHPFVAVVIGCINGTVGGMIRDILCNVTPSVLREDLYATISLAGGAVFVLIQPLMDVRAAMGVSFGLMLVARLVVIQRGARG
ncbi:trimeric intracellular cation channel family protein [Thiosulfatihalobacter marinus]|uniref:trimeric intracellular cation channel family protein n=1 Tax=Thiosulfatihalobacter marinus TaxID=2792481 RepID=UPI001E4F0E59|nr:TRIC cation channel family protein [Thiosulfatihalobacter marinus]